MDRRRRYNTLASLLDAQPAGLRKDPRHRLLWDHFMASEKLQRLRISRRCYSLLNRARIKPENLESFYKTYRLPKDSFFPLFLAVKSKWLNSRQQWKEERRKFIRDTLDALPEKRKNELNMLAFLERKYQSAGSLPVWNHVFVPVSRKRVKEMAAYTEAEWQKLYSLFLGKLSRKYRRFSPEEALKTEALLMLGFDPRKVDREGLPGRNEIITNFRTLSKVHHPDRGGESALFRRLKAAKEILS